MLLTEMNIKDFNEVLASDSPAPGGGSVAAMEAAMGAGLIAMVCRLTVRSRKYIEFHENCGNAAEVADRLRKRFIALIDEDTESFNKVSAAYKMPRESDEEKAVRSAAIQEALKGSVMPPLEVLKLAASCLGLIKELRGKSNASAASDLGVAAASLWAALNGAWLNVKINIDGLKDRKFAEECEAECLNILETSLPLAESLIVL